MERNVVLVVLAAAAWLLYWLFFRVTGQHLLEIFKNSPTLNKWQRLDSLAHEVQWRRIGNGPRFLARYFLWATWRQVEKLKANRLILEQNFPTESNGSHADIRYLFAASKLERYGYPLTEYRIAPETQPPPSTAEAECEA